MTSILVFLVLILIACLLVKTWYYIWKITLFLILFAILFLIWGASVDAHEYTPEDVVLIGKIVEHEAPNESELGKRLVIDTVLNRVDSPRFPNSVKEVLSQPGQYCSPSKYPPNDTYRLVAEELYFRTNTQVLWYRTKRYHKYGTPIIKEGNHYFSGGK